MSKAAVYAERIFRVVLFEFELGPVPDHKVRECLDLTPSQYAAGKKYLRLNPTSRLGFGYASGIKGFQLTTKRDILDQHWDRVVDCTDARLNHGNDEITIEGAL